MLIGLCGGICAGKHTVARYLAEHHGFTHLYLLPRDAKSTPPLTNSDGSTSLNGMSEGLTDYTRQANGSTVSSVEKGSHAFNSADDLLNFVTKRWRERWVTTDIYTETVLDKYLNRPFFILVSVDAPVSVRWKRFQARSKRDTTSDDSLEGLSLEQFLLRSDEHLYNPESGLLPLISRATVRLLNTSSDIAHLYATLGKLDLTNEDRLRPNWDQYFMQLALLAAQRSNCMKRRVGCVLVREKRVISTGYNGTPRGVKNCSEGGCPRCNDGQGSGVGLGTCLCLHAEENALLEAGRDRIREGTILYCDTCPCLTCSIKIAQVGISEVVYNKSYSMDLHTTAIFKEAGVQLRQFSPPVNGLIHLEKQSF
ncbi:cytidine deaminase-like protein [Xylogone sp. PMI_703]|nr:cytidine deaminase-like protein [Xylogone sp. PMI_703]